MKPADSKREQLLVEWSPTHVRLVEGKSLRSTEGATLRECLGESPHERDAVVGVCQGNAFIRTLAVPDASRSDIAKVLEIQMDQVLPLGAGEYVFGFRLSDETPGKGRTAIVGAVRRESVRRIYSEAEACGLRVRAVLPLAFASWLAARRHSLSECAVAGFHNGAVSIDIVSGGELLYSRSIPNPGGEEEIEDEIGRTFSISQIPTSPIVASRGTDLRADVVDDRESIEYFADLDVVGKQLFSLALPADRVAQERRVNRWRMGRALAAAAAAIALGGYAGVRDLQATRQGSPATSKLTKDIETARANRDAAMARIDRENIANGILNVAFAPSQNFTDMVNALSNAASARSWFTSMTIGRGKPVSITGIALSDSDVADFAAAASQSPRFRDMKVVSAAKTSIGKKAVTQFTLTGLPVGSLPFDHPPKRSKTR